MKLKNSDYTTLANKIKCDNLKIVIYGAGMIGVIVVPYLIKTYGLYDNVLCYVDMDDRKNGQYIEVGHYRYEIKSPEILKNADEKIILFITNSILDTVLEYLESIPALANTEGYIIPLMQISNAKQTEMAAVPRYSDKKCIPPKIHYCWFGDAEMPEFLQNCVHTWEKYCPDYEIVKWNESNYDVNKHQYTKEAYKKGKFGFVSDYARLDILYENGGIYLDTDVELIRGLDDLLYQPGFIGVEKWGNLNSGGGSGFMQGHPMLKKMLDVRCKVSFLNPDGSMNLATNGIYETRPFLDYGFEPNNTLQVIEGVTIYPSCVTHPYDYMTGKLDVWRDTFSIHHFNGGWMTERELLRRERTQNRMNSLL